MRSEFDRRGLLGLGLTGGALALLPGGALAAVPMRGFTHSVASGDPAAESVLLWTRFVGTGSAAQPLRVEVAAEPGFGRIVARAEGVAEPAADWCVRVRAEGLTPGKWYFYRFIGPDGTRSETGRTRTLPVGRTDRFNVAVFSCSNIGFGYFNAYGHAAKRNDIDLVVHVGDYLYEYENGKYPDAGKGVAGRLAGPAGEIIKLDDYRMRYADYRRDPDLRALHRRFPMISIWDDHEFANDAWKDGAENHQPDEGDWAARKAVARQAYQEWLPVGSRAYNRYDIGDLTSLLVLDTRVEGRDRQLSLAPVIKGGREALIGFRDGAWSDAKRTLLGFEQERWLADNLKASTAAGTRWQLVAQQIVMGKIVSPKQAADWLGPDAAPRAKAYMQAGLLAASIGLPMNLDSWGGYDPARSRLLKSAQDANADLVVVSGDSHNAWACDLAEGGKPAGVEFAGQGVTSPGFEAALKADPKIVEAGVIGANPELKWADLSRRGYLTVAFTPAAARADWVFMKTIRSPSYATGPGHTATVRRGERRMMAA